MDTIRFLNLDYIFYQIYRFFHWLGFILYGQTDQVSDTGTFGTTTGSSGSGLDLSSAHGGWLDGLFNGFFLGVLQTIVGIIFLILCGMIFYSILRWREELSKQNELFEKNFAEPVVAPVFYKNQKWPIVLGHLESTTQSEWRLAILEADNMLGDLTAQQNIPGGTLGERLSNANPQTFRTLQSAWEAHKVRNRIAHEGADFELSQREARRIVALYEDVFREFNYI